MGIVALHHHLFIFILKQVTKWKWLYYTILSCTYILFYSINSIVSNVFLIFIGTDEYGRTAGIIGSFLLTHFATKLFGWSAHANALPLPQAQLAEKTTLLSEARLKEQGFVERVSIGPWVGSLRGRVCSKSHAACSQDSVASSESSYCSPATST